MKRLLNFVISFTLVAILYTASLQAQSGNNAHTYADTIVLLGQQRIVCNIMRVSPLKIRYNIPDSSESQYVKRNNVQRIIYETGREEQLNEPLIQDVDEKSWVNVVITQNKKLVEGMNKLGTVKSKSWPRSNDKEEARRTARVRLRKKGLGKGASIILLTNERVSGGFGEIPTYHLTGMAYGF